MKDHGEHRPARTPVDLIEAASLGARIAVRAGIAGGLKESAIRRRVIGRFRRELLVESFGPFADETLMAAVQTAVESVLGELRGHVDFDPFEPQALGGAWHENHHPRSGVE
jgi:hypothetical protein